MALAESFCAEVRRFCGLTDCYWLFVPMYSELATPHTALCCPAAWWSGWGAREATSFMALRQLLSAAEPVLRTFNPSPTARVWPWVTTSTDASQTAIAARGGNLDAGGRCGEQPTGGF